MTLPVLFAILASSMVRNSPCIQTLTTSVPERSLRLRDLVLVVGEFQVDPAGVDVEALAEVLEAHGRALDVPAGEAVAPR